MVIPSPFLFVYGTLMQGFDSPYATRLRAGASYVSAGSFPGELYQITWFPGAVYVPTGASLVHGEVYRMADPERLLALLDEYEEILPNASASLYIRREVVVQLTDGRALSCQVYLYNQSIQGLPRLASGSFLP